VHGNAQQHPRGQRRAACFLRPPWGERHNGSGYDPRGVVETTRLVAVVCDQHEIDAVGDREQCEAAGKEPHAGWWPPMIEREQRSDDQQKQDVE
jgi:hypothetical protein